MTDPKLLANLTSSNYHNKFPFSTLIFLLWIHNYQIKKSLFARLLVLHSDDTWLKFQKYNDNVNNWTKILSDFNWKWLLQKIDKMTFEERIDQILYPYLKNIGAVSAFGKLHSKKLNITSKQFQFNPDWDEDIIINLFNLFGENLEWTPPRIPKIVKSIVGQRKKIPLAYIKEIGISNFIKQNYIFSYAIPSPRIFNFTSFGKNNCPSVSPPPFLAPHRRVKDGEEKAYEILELKGYLDPHI